MKSEKLFSKNPVAYLTPAPKTTRRLIATRYLRPDRSKELNTWSNRHLQCQKSKIQRYTKPPVSQIPIQRRRFENLYMRSVGRLPLSKGYRYIFAIIDRFSRWSEAFALRDVSANKIASTFLNNYISRLGVHLSRSIRFALNNC